MDAAWNAQMTFEGKLFSPVFKEILEELLENKELKSIVDFSYKYRRSYMQISKYKRWLHKKGFITLIKEGKQEKMVLTEQGRKIITAFGKLLAELRLLDKGGVQ